MFATQASMSWWTWTLHFTMTIIGAYLIANLALAVIFLQFTKYYEDAKAEQMDPSMPSGSCRLRGTVKLHLCAYYYPQLRLYMDRAASLFLAGYSTLQQKSDITADFRSMRSTMNLFRKQQVAREQLQDGMDEANKEGREAVAGNGGGHLAQGEVQVQSYGPIRRYWELLRDICDIIQVG